MWQKMRCDRRLRHQIVGDALLIDASRSRRSAGFFLQHFVFSAKGAA